MENKLVLTAILCMALVGCGDGDSKRENPGTNIDVSGDSNVLTVVDSSGSECSTGVIIRYYRQNGDFINEQCAGTGPEEDCGDCFDVEFLEANEFLSHEGCVEEMVLDGECGDEGLIDQAQAADAEEDEESEEEEE